MAGAGLVVTQALETGGDQDKASVATRIICTTTGEVFVVGDCPLPPTADAQKMGSAITYIRRYSLMAAFGFAGEDDDGNAAVSSTTRQPAAPGNNISAAKADDAFL